MAGTDGRYFVVKSYNLQGLEKSRISSEWACSERKTGPQTWKILAEAFSQGRVVLIFSVNNCHGYHGYASLTSAPNPVAEDLNLAAEGTGENQLMQWHKFNIRWEQLFLEEHGEQCLPFSQTQHIKCSDGTMLNKARNFQELQSGPGSELCSLIDKEYSRVTDVKMKKLEVKESKLPKPFLQLEDSEKVQAADTVDCDWEDLWKTVLGRVSEIGEVIVACAFGSQRYNCHTEHSDMDMFIVYQASTEKVLGFDPPALTIKNREKEKLDYTILELYRFCELLLAGDPRCIETLFLDSSSIYHQSPLYTEMCTWKQKLLTRTCIDKYLNDACGAKGIRLMDKWVKCGDALFEPMPKKVGKLFYIIIRLLQNARDIAESNTLVVHRSADSEDRRTLMQARSSELSYSRLRGTVESLEKQVRDYLKESSGKDSSQDQSFVRQVEDWLIKRRYMNLKQHFGDQN